MCERLHGAHAISRSDVVLSAPLLVGTPGERAVGNDLSAILVGRLNQSDSVTYSAKHCERCLVCEVDGAQNHVFGNPERPRKRSVLGRGLNPRDERSPGVDLLVPAFNANRHRR